MVKEGQTLKVIFFIMYDFHVFINNVLVTNVMRLLVASRVLAGKHKLSPFLVNWENVVFIYSIFFII